MPILFQTKDPDDQFATLAIWHLTDVESIDFFKKSPPPSIQPFFKDFLVKNEEKIAEKQRQSACAEFLVQKITDFKFYTEKDEFGKPQLVALDSKGAVPTSSRSHSTDFVAAIAHTQGQLVGIDIQELDPRMPRIMPRLLSDSELNFIKKEKKKCNSEQILDLSHIFWGAKEALYKAHGRRGLDFKENIKIDPFLYIPFEPFFPISAPAHEAGATHWVEGTARVEMGDFNKKFTLKSMKLENYMLVYCIETR